MSPLLQLDIAEIVDPAAFMASKHEGNFPSMSKKSALTKAAAILALLKQAGVIVVVENEESCALS